MSFRELILAGHIIAGFAGLVLGLVAMSAKKRRGRHSSACKVYHWAVLLTCVLASVLSFLDWTRLWWFLPIAAGSYTFAFVGYLAAKVRRKNWLLWHVNGQGGSYIAMVTALLAVNWETISGTSGVRSPLAWTLPTLVGSTVTALISRRIRKQQYDTDVTT